MDKNIEIRWIGNSKGIIIPADILKELNLDIGDFVNLRTVNGNDGKYLIVDPMKE